jgi:hypothetical protein
MFKVALIRNAEKLNIAQELDKDYFINKLVSYTEQCVDGGIEMKKAMYISFAKILDELKKQALYLP